LRKEDVASIIIHDRIASPEMFPEAEMLPHVICSRPILIGGLMMRRISMAARDKLVAVVADRYARGDRDEQGLILDEFAAVTGYHRKHAMRLLRAGQMNRRWGPRPGRRIYDEAVREALIVVWEASDRICGKRLRPLLPILVERRGRQRRAGRGNIGPTDGNISVGPYSGTAPPVMWAAER